MKNILITGATGFIGREVCRQLRRLGYTVSGTTRDTGLHAGPENIPLHYIQEFSCEMDWSQAVAGADAIVHLAARVHQMRDQVVDPMSEYRRVNVEGTKSLATVAAAAGVKRFIFLSSIKVNGEKTIDTPFSERDTPAPIDPYGISKWEAEQALAKINSHSSLDTVILRSPLVYGPNAGGNFATLVRAVIKRWPIPLGAVANLRSLVYVGNLVSAIVQCLVHPSARGKTFFVSDGEDLSTVELVRRMAEAAGVVPRIFSCPLWCLHAAGVLTGRRQIIEKITDSLQLDSEHIRQALSWSPPFSVEDGLRESMKSGSGSN